MIDKEEMLGSIDLGQLRDPSAFVVMRKTERYPIGSIEDPTLNQKVNYYEILAIKRWLGVNYPKIVENVKHYYTYPQLKFQSLSIDVTGVGRAVLDIFRESGIQASIVPITITAGSAITHKPDGWHVAKKHLVGCLQSVISQHRLSVAAEITDAKQLIKELTTFKMKLNKLSGETSFEAWRETDHDDIPLSICCGLFLAEKNSNKIPFRILNSSKFNNKKVIKIVHCPRSEMEMLAIDHKTLLVCIHGHGSPHETPIHRLDQNMDVLHLSFADIVPDDYKDCWEKLIPGYEKLPNDLQMSLVDGKKLWSFMTKKRSDQWEVAVIMDEGFHDRRGLSICYAMADIMRLDRTKAIYRVSSIDGNKELPKDPPNKHVYDQVKHCRNLVI